MITRWTAVTALGAKVKRPAVAPVSGQRRNNNTASIMSSIVNRNITHSHCRQLLRFGRHLQYTGFPCPCNSVRKAISRMRT